MTAVLLSDIRERDLDAAGRRMPGHLVECERCGGVVRRLSSVRTEAHPADHVLVAPDPMPGNWNRALWGYGEGRLDGREPETCGSLWVIQRSGLAARFDSPPSTVTGFRDHALDCGFTAAERASMS